MNYVPSSYLQALVAVAEQQEVTPFDLFHPDHVDEGRLIPGAKIDEIAFVQAFNTLKNITAELSLMLDFAELLAERLSAPYVNGKGMARNVEEAIDFEFCRTNPFLDFTITNKGDYARVALLSSKMVDAEVVEFKAKTLYYFLAAICPELMAGVEVRLGHTMPVTSVEDLAMGDCKISFSRPYNELLVDEAILQTELRVDESQILPNDPIARLIEESDLVRGMLDFIENHLDKVPLKIEDAALEIGVSPRTLQRYLKAQDVTFVQLRDSVKKRHAIRMLQEGELSLADISKRLGFADVSGFHHAFKRWTERSPKEYRQHLAVA